jgi:hypothetical protein
MRFLITLSHAHNKKQLARIPFSENLVEGPNVTMDRNSPDYGRHRIQPRNASCQYCKAKMWDEEKLTTSTNDISYFGQCCLSGTIDLPPLHDVPQEIDDLITKDANDGKQFLFRIRLYNSVLAFTSTTAKVDEKLMSATNGCYTYRINGSIYHQISSYLPNPDFNPQFSQIYIYDRDMQVSLRSGMFPKAIKATILNTIQRFLELNNPYVKIYMHAGETLRKDPSTEFNIILKADVKNDRTKNAPTADEIAVLMVDDGSTLGNSRDIVIKSRNNNENPLSIISESHHVYDPLAYPLLHLYGESGWQYNKYQRRSKGIYQYKLHDHPLSTFDQIVLENSNDYQLPDIQTNPQINAKKTSKVKYVSARDFYAYRLHDRPRI